MITMASSQLLYETMIDHMSSFQTSEEDFMTFKVRTLPI